MSSLFVPASELKSGDTIKLSIRHSKKLWIQEIITLDASNTRKHSLHGHLKLVFWSCQSLIVSPDRQFFRVYSPKTQEKEVAHV